jgi:hypothetical protein
MVILPVPRFVPVFVGLFSIAAFFPKISLTHGIVSGEANHSLRASHREFAD